VVKSLTSLLRDSGGSAGSPVLACPGWSVRDAVAHLIESCRRAERRLRAESAAPPIAASPDLDQLELPALLAEWDRSGAAVGFFLTEPEHSHRGSIMVMEAFTHELDIRAALGAPVPAGHPAFHAAFEVAVGGLSGSIMSLRLPPLGLMAGAETWIAGDGEPGTVVHGSPVDLFRSMTGRRTRQQIRTRLTWSDEPGPWLPAFGWGPFRLPVTPVE
jgi:uncharacterized protein (TIGR03083 family)